MQMNNEICYNVFTFKTIFPRLVLILYLYRHIRDRERNPRTTANAWSIWRGGAPISVWKKKSREEASRYDLLEMSSFDIR